jgi:hypothetical protein
MGLAALRNLSLSFQLPILARNRTVAFSARLRRGRRGQRRSRYGDLHHSHEARHSPTKVRAWRDDSTEYYRSLTTGFVGHALVDRFLTHSLTSPQAMLAWARTFFGGPLTNPPGRW